MYLIRISTISSASIIYLVGFCLGFQQTRNSANFPNKLVMKKEYNKKLVVLRSQNSLRESWWEEDISKDDIMNTSEADSNSYWFHDDIHTLGNTGILGGLHAAMAPLSTKVIDLFAYNGRNVRETIAKQLMERILHSQSDTDQKRNELKILDLGCGVGMSTMAIASAARGIERSNVTVTGIDTSPEMIGMARATDRKRKRIAKFSKDHKCEASKAHDEDHNSTILVDIETEFLEANAENTPFPRDSFDLVTIMYVFHEAPFRGRAKILREARRVLKPGGILAVVDISQEYKPSASMLSGEPYLQEYQQNFASQLSSFKGFRVRSEEVIVPGHVILYTAMKNSRSWFRKRFLSGWKMNS